MKKTLTLVCHFSEMVFILGHFFLQSVQTDGISTETMQILAKSARLTHMALVPIPIPVPNCPSGTDTQQQTGQTSESACSKYNLL